MRRIRALIILMGFVFLFGCASPSKMENMVLENSSASQLTYDKNLNTNIEVGSVSGGKKTNPAWTSEIDNEAFGGALAQSLKNAGLLASDGGKYQLEVSMLSVDQPLFGLNFKVVTKIQYKLKEISSGNIIFDEVITAEHTAKVGDAFVAVKRLRLANEGSAKENIKALLQAFSELKVDVSEVSLVQ